MSLKNTLVKLLPPLSEANEKMQGCFRSNSITYALELQLFVRQAKNHISRIMLRDDTTNKYKFPSEVILWN